MDRPIIFSGPMVGALLDGSKTQTRRLARSPLARVDIGDRLYVRESFVPHYFDDLKPAYKADWTDEAAYYCPEPKWSPSIHMPRRISRLTLTVTNIRVQHLNDITNSDILAEGPPIIHTCPYSGQPMVATHQPGVTQTVSLWFHRLWNKLHQKSEDQWENNPEIIALTFEVARQNIDA